MTVGELIAAVRRYLREPSADEWTDAGLVEYMNWAQRELGPELHIRGYGTIATNTTNQSYPLSGLTGLLEIVAVDLDGTPLSPVPIDSTSKGYWRWRDATGTADHIWLWAKPSAAGTLKIWYWKAASDLSASNLSATPDFDSRWHHILVPFAAAHAYFEANSFEAGDGYMNMFNNIRREMAAAWLMEFGGAPHKIQAQSSWTVN
ncbi:MAG: hypothetical protein AB1760_00330 [Pseudomonadota bacterium]